MNEQIQNASGRGERRYDVVVVGGGAAGLSGALTLGRARRSVLVVDAGRPRNAPAEHVHTYLTREGTPPSELLETGRAEVAGYGGEIMTVRPWRPNAWRTGGSASSSRTAPRSWPAGCW